MDDRIQLQHNLDSTIKKNIVLSMQYQHEVLDEKMLLIDKNQFLENKLADETNLRRKQQLDYDDALIRKDRLINDLGNDANKFQDQLQKMYHIIYI